MRVAPGFHKLVVVVHRHRNCRRIWPRKYVGSLGVRRPLELVGNSQVAGDPRHFVHFVQVANSRTTTRMSDGGKNARRALLAKAGIHPESSHSSPIVTPVILSLHQRRHLPLRTPIHNVQLRRRRRILPGSRSFRVSTLTRRQKKSRSTILGGRCVQAVTATRKVTFFFFFFFVPCLLR